MDAIHNYLILNAMVDDHYKPLKLIVRYKPIFDAYFGPLKDKHHYWFGVLFLAQGVLLVISSIIP